MDFAGQIGSEGGDHVEKLGSHGRSRLEGLPTLVPAEIAQAHDRQIDAGEAEDQEIDGTKDTIGFIIQPVVDVLTPLPEGAMMLGGVLLTFSQAFLIAFGFSYPNVIDH